MRASPSDLDQAHVAVELQGGPMPVGDPLGLWKLANPFSDQLADIMQGPTERQIRSRLESRTSSEDLPFPSRQELRVELAELQVAEEQFHRRRVVLVRTTVDVLEAQLPGGGPRLLTLVVGGVVPEDYGVFLPSGRLGVQSTGEVLQE